MSLTRFICSFYIVCPAHIQILADKEKALPFKGQGRIPISRMGEERLVRVLFQMLFCVFSGFVGCINVFFRSVCFGIDCGFSGFFVCFDSVLRGFGGFFSSIGLRCIFRFFSNCFLGIGLRFYGVFGSIGIGVDRVFRGIRLLFRRNSDDFAGSRFDSADRGAFLILVDDLHCCDTGKQDHGCEDNGFNDVIHFGFSLRFFKNQRIP